MIRYIILLVFIIGCTLDENYTILKKPDVEENHSSLGQYINVIATDSNNNLWLGVEYPGAVYKSNNYNYKWMQTELTNFSVRDIFISEEDDVYVINYDYYHHPDSSIMKSTDGGETWQPIGIPEYGFSSLTETESNILIAGSYNSIYISFDEGINWIKSNFPIEEDKHYWFDDIAMHDAYNVFIELAGGINSRLVKYNIETEEYKSYGRLSHIEKIIISNEGDVFIGHAAHDEAGGGISRILSNIDTIEYFHMDHNNTFGLWIPDLTMDQNGNLLVASSEGIQVSNDKGETWFQVLPDSVFTAITVDNNNIIYAGTINGYVIKIAEIEKLIGL